MRSAPSEIVSLEERLVRPPRLGLFGHRGVGKTTFLTMLYREAVGGRLPDLRLAAGDATTAAYLADRILQLEEGQPLPATLAETDLRLQLYHRDSRIELVVKDYQGEHVRLGSAEPIRDFLRDCDAVLLCLDPAVLDDPRERLQAQQEVEQVVEDFLAVENGSPGRRPMALVLTKSDRLPPATAGEDEEAGLRRLAETYLGMTLHALRQHSPEQPLFAVSSLGRPVDQTGPLEPRHLDRPLLWLAGALQAQDEQRLQRLIEAGASLATAERCAHALARRYPGSEIVAGELKRLAERRRRRRRRWSLAGVATVVACALGLYGYEAVGARSMQQRDRSEDDPAALQREWQEYRSSHPARHVLGFASPEAEEQRLAQLREQQTRQEATARLAELKARAAHPDADPEQLWEQYLVWQRDFAGLPFDEDLGQLRELLKVRRDERLAQKATLALAELQRGQELLDGEQDSAVRRQRLVALVARADAFLQAFPGVPQQSEVTSRREQHLALIDDLDFDAAQGYSRENPINFQTRRERYQAYLAGHPQGSHVARAQTALGRIEREWDVHDFRPVYQQWKQNAAEVNEVTARCRHYLRQQPQGRYRAKAEELIRWCTQVSEGRDYRVVLKSGSFEKDVARWLTKTPDLSIELEVAGVKYGPSNVVKDSLTPEWNYEFPRPIRWKLGDSVVIRVANHDYYKKVMLEIHSADGLLGMNLLSTTVTSGGTSVVFESDYRMPHMPDLD